MKQNQEFLERLNLILRWSPDEISTNREYIYELSKKMGSYNKEELFATLNIFLEKNAYYRIHMQAGCIFYEGRGDFNASMNFAKYIYNENQFDNYVAIKYASLLFASGEFSAAKSILYRILFNSPSESEIEIVISLFCDMVSFVEADILFEKYQPQGKVILEKRIDLSLGKKKYFNKSIPLYYINLPSDSRKRILFEKLQFVYHEKIIKVDGFIGSSLPKLFRNILNPNNKISAEAGTIGCFISHVRCWEMIANGEDDCGIVMEDDGLPFMGFDIEQVSEILFDSSIDLLFINKRMSSLISDKFTFTGISNFSDRLLTIPDTQAGWGGDGYILKKNTAINLLKNIGTDLICGHLDGQLASYSSVFLPDENQSRALNTYRSFNLFFKSNSSITAVALNFPLISDNDFGFSSREFNS